jgi:hypothetical protein
MAIVPSISRRRAMQRESGTFYQKDAIGHGHGPSDPTDRAYCGDSVGAAI